MKVLMTGIKETYLFTCPVCKSKLEAEKHEVEEISDAEGVYTFICPVCKKKRYIHAERLFVKSIFVDELKE